MYKTVKKSSRSNNTIIKSLSSKPPIINSFKNDYNIEMSLPNLTPSPYNTSSSSDYYSESDNNMNTIPIGYFSNSSRKSSSSRNNNNNNKNKSSQLFHGLEIEKKNDNVYGFTSDEDNNTKNTKSSRRTKKTVQQHTQQHQQIHRIGGNSTTYTKKLTPFQKLDAMSIIEIRIILCNNDNNTTDKENYIKETKLLVTAGILHKREEEMKNIFLNQQEQEESNNNDSGNASPSSITKWNGTLIYQECNKQITNNDNNQYNNIIHSKKRKKQVIIQIQQQQTTNGQNNFTVEILQITLYRLFQDGIIYCTNACTGNDILKLLEYFQILYKPQQMQFESIGCYLRIRMWAHYYLNRNYLKDYILNEIVHGSGAGVKVRRGVGFIILNDDDEEYDNCNYVYKGRKLMIFNIDMVIDLFSPTQCDDNHEDDCNNDEESVDYNNNNNNDGDGIDEILRQDFSNYLQNSLPGTHVSFKVDDVKKVYDNSNSTNHVIGLSPGATTESSIDKYAVLYVDFYPRTPCTTTKAIASTSTTSNNKKMAQKSRNELKKQKNRKLLVSDALSIDRQQQDNNNSSFDNDDNNNDDNNDDKEDNIDDKEDNQYYEDDIAVRKAAKKITEIIGSTSDTSVNDSDDNDDKEGEDTENDIKNIVVDTATNNNDDDVKINDIYDHCQNTPIKNNMSLNSDSDSKLNDIKTSLKYSYFKQMSINNSPKNSDIDSDIENRDTGSKIPRCSRQQIVEEDGNLTPTKKSSSSDNALNKLPPPPTPISPTNVADVSMINNNSTTQSQTTTETKNTANTNVVTTKDTAKKDNSNKVLLYEDDDTQDEITVDVEEDTKSTTTNLWMVENEENFDILEWYQNLWDMKSITSFTSNNNNNINNDNNNINNNETATDINNNNTYANDGQSFIGPMFSFASDDLSVLSGTIMSQQEVLEDNVLDSFASISNKKENISCFGASSCIPMTNEDGEGNNNDHWFCSNVLEPTMVFTMQLCDLNYDGEKNDDKNTSNDTTITTNPATMPCDATDNNSIIKREDNDI